MIGNDRFRTRFDSAPALSPNFLRCTLLAMLRHFNLPMLGQIGKVNDNWKLWIYIFQPGWFCSSSRNPPCYDAMTFPPSLVSRRFTSTKNDPLLSGDPTLTSQWVFDPTVNGWRWIWIISENDAFLQRYNDYRTFFLAIPKYNNIWSNHPFSKLSSVIFILEPLT